MDCLVRRGMSNSTVLVWSGIGIGMVRMVGFGGLV